MPTPPDPVTARRYRPVDGAPQAVAAAASAPKGPRREPGYCERGVLSSTGTRKFPSLISWVRSATMALTSAGSLSSQA
jgi:hypothetical protein